MKKKKNNCNTGKPCGYSCIPVSKKCRVELSNGSSNSVESLLKGLFQGEATVPDPPEDIKMILNGLPSPSDSSSPQTSATGNSIWAREEAEDFDGRLKGKLTREGDPNYNGWADSYGSGSYSIGGGENGQVIRNGDGVFVKRGGLSTREASILRKAGEAGLGPKLVAADTNGIDVARNRPGAHVEIRKGRIAMTEVPGLPLEEYSWSGRVPDGKGGTQSIYDAYWKGMSQLHRIGIAHNDGHSGNIFIDGGGKVRWVDFGLSQDSPRAALAEAMGVFPPLRGVLASRAGSATGKRGNWQSARSKVSGVLEANEAWEDGPTAWASFKSSNPTVARIWENRERAQARLQEMGLSRSEVSGIIVHGIRSPDKSFQEGAWKKLSDRDVEEVLSIIYDGV